MLKYDLHKEMIGCPLLQAKEANSAGMQKDNEIHCKSIDKNTKGKFQRELLSSPSDGCMAASTTTISH